EFQRRTMGARITDFAGHAGERASRGGLRASGGNTLAAARAGGETVHGIDAGERGRSQGCDVDGQRYLAGVRAGEHAGQLAGGHGEIHSSGGGSGVSDALHNEWKSGNGRDADWIAFCERSAEAAGADAAINE